MRKKVQEPAFAYFRVSGVRQTDGEGPDRQREAIESYAKSAGYKIVDEFLDEISGTTRLQDRPGFKQLRQAILDNGVRVVIVERLDRFARDMDQQVIGLIYLKELGITLIDASTGDNITEAKKKDPMFKAFVGIRGIFAELEKDMAVLRMKSARDELRRQGYKAEGRRLYGETEEERNTLVQIKAMRGERARGGPGLTFRAIADRLNAERVPTKSGVPWTAPQVAYFLRPRPKLKPIKRKEKEAPNENPQS